MDESPTTSPRAPAGPVTTAAVTDRRATPGGVLPRGIQTWLLAGLAAFMLLIMLVGMAIVSLWTPFTVERIAERWFSLPNFYFLWPIPAVTVAVAYLVWRWLMHPKRHDALPFLGTIVLFLLGYAGLVISTVPYLVPPHLTFWDTAAAPESQIFLLIGTLFLLPMVLGYTIFVYWIFRGKVAPGEGYH